MHYAAQANRRVLFVGNRRLLITQATGTASRFEIPHGVIMASHDCGDSAATNQIASIQTLESWYFYDPTTGELVGRGKPPADLLIVDECDQDEARYRALFSLYPDAKILGLTATPVGAEGKSIVPGLFDVLIEVEDAKNSKLIEQRYLLPTKVWAPSEPNIEGVKIQNRQEYNQRSLGKAVKECTVFGDVLGEWMGKGADRATVVFVPGIPYGRDIVEQFNFTLGEGSFCLIEAKTKPEERERIHKALEQREVKGVVSCDVLKIGWDCPVVSCMINLQPENQLRSFWQKVGRIKRPFGDQTHAILLDFAGSYWKFPHPDHDPAWPIGDITTKEAIERRREEGVEAQPIMCPACGFVRDKGPRCPSCGTECGDPIRRIRMGQGKLLEVPAVAKKLKEKSADELAFSKWQQVLFGGLHSGRTYGQCAHLYNARHGDYPKYGWPGTHPKGDLGWKRRVTDEHTTRSLADACRWMKERLRDE